jgi:hypothetical protein
MSVSLRQLLAVLAILSPMAGVAVSVSCSASPLDLGATAVSVDGTWVGHIESYHFADNDDHLRLTITRTPDGTVDASVFLGTGPPLAPPTDPDVAYPPGYWSASNPPCTTSMAELPAPVERFEFTAHDLSVEAGGRVQVSFAQPEAWAAWCALQKKIYFVGDDGGPETRRYACCAPDASTDAGGFCDPSQTTPSDPGKLALCPSLDQAWPHCTCNASQCGIDASTGDTHLDLQLGTTGDTLQGSILGLGRYGIPFTVYLARSP